MHGPALSGWLLAALSAATGAYCLARMRSCSGGVRRAAGGEALMGFGMAAMAVPAAALDPPLWAWTAGAGVFGGAALLSLAAARHGGHHLHHAVGSLAMVYMAVLMADPSGGGHSGHAPSPSGIPLLTGALFAYYAVYVLRSGTRLAPSGGAGPGPASGPTPELVPACRLVMGLGMLAMLLAL
ncbi:DUF5134 domain-containing protein [Streptomyces qinzhouensis]|uniref:DUF5134 domain-containing protein n=1 Tax=Streptomyces qinzhouensis TaxID=2599401 RepID=A0A5B8J2T1_9ACTN|nr:DUF5134 domain-containing protein [Streptomyces qinzhouensis]QDY75517.1 DUF5134 domain-containing protein [Streptomyces qinzhouensis]